MTDTITPLERTQHRIAFIDAFVELGNPALRNGMSDDEKMKRVDALVTASQWTIAHDMEWLAEFIARQDNPGATITTDQIKRIIARIQAPVEDTT
jgi:hypothetical protein